MSSYVEIANLTGSLIGTEARITDPDDDRTLPRAIKAVWDSQRRDTIRDGEWNFACRRVALPALAPASAPVSYPWKYAFQKPAESLRILEVLNASASDAFKVEGQWILADAGPPLYVRYLVDEPDEVLWDESFANAFAARLAWSIGEKIAGSAYNKTDGWTVYQSFLNKAKGTDGRENPPLEQAESSWIIARWAGAYWRG